MKLKTLLLVPMLALAVPARADGPTSQPSATTQPSAAGPVRREGKSDNGMGGGSGGRMGRRDGYMPGAKPTQEEIDDTIAYVKANFPNHYELFSNIPENAPFRKVAIQKMVNRYRQLLRMQDQAPEAYDAVLRQAKFEDDAIGFARDADQNKPDADVRLREVVRRMIERGLNERKDRIAKLRSALSEQEKKLKEDEDAQEKLITDQIVRTRQEYQRMLRPKDRSDADPADGSREINAMRK